METSFAIIEVDEAATSYNGGDEVSHNDRRYRAQWWIQDEEPGVASVWADIGPASCH